MFGIVCDDTAVIELSAVIGLGSEASGSPEPTKPMPSLARLLVRPCAWRVSSTSPTDPSLASSLTTTMVNPVTPGTSSAYSTISG